MTPERHIKSVTRRELSRIIKQSDTSESDKSYGAGYAEVTDERDPLFLGRIRVRLPYMTQDKQTEWIPPMGGFHGNGFGSTFDIPCKGDTVRIHNVLGNTHNMVYTPSFYHEAEKADITEVKAVNTPEGAEGKYVPTEKERKNIWRSMSGWLLDIIEGSSVAQKWRLIFSSPTTRDLFHWFAPRHEQSGRPYSTVFIKVDDLLEFWDESSPDGEKAVFRWEYLLKLIEMQMHKGGRLVIRDHTGSSLSWDDASQMVEIKMPQNKAFLVDRAGGNFVYDAATSKISMKLINNLEVIAQAIRFGATTEFEIKIGTPVAPGAVSFPAKPGNGGKFNDVKDPITPPGEAIVAGMSMLHILPGSVTVGGEAGLPVGRVGDVVEVIVPGIGICYGTIKSGSTIVKSA
jgi:hypothetical protein